jgi:HEPN domain-containing protein
VVYACTVLSKFYTPTRYPDVWSEGIPEDYYSRREAEEAIRIASEVIDWVRELWRRLSKRVKTREGCTGS